MSKFDDLKKKILDKQHKDILESLKKLFGKGIDGIDQNIEYIKTQLEELPAGIARFDRVQAKLTDIEHKTAKYLSETEDALKTQNLALYEDMKTGYRMVVDQLQIMAGNIQALKEFRVPEEFSVKEPAWYKQFDLAGFFSKLKDILADFIQNLQSRTFIIKMPDHENPKNALSVRLVNKRGQVVDLPIVVHGGGGGGAGKDPVGLKDSAGTTINPAKEDGNLATLVLELKLFNGGLALRYDDAGSGIAYQGWAEPGTATSSATWRIRKIDTTGDPDTIITFADGNRNFDNVWDNRASLSYS